MRSATLAVTCTLLGIAHGIADEIGEQPAEGIGLHPHLSALRHLDLDQPPSRSEARAAACTSAASSTSRGFSPASPFTKAM